MSQVANNDILELPLAAEQTRQSKPRKKFAKKTADKKKQARKKRRPRPAVSSEPELSGVEDEPIHGLPNDEDLDIVDVTANMEAEEFEEEIEDGIDDFYNEDLDESRKVTQPSSPDPTAVLPEPTTDTAALPTVETEQTLPAPALEEPSRGVNKQWDMFMLRLRDTTRVAVWELGIDALVGGKNAFTAYAKEDLTQPRGRLTESQADEIETLLIEFGLSLPKSSRVTQIRGGLAGGRGAVRSGVRVPIKVEPLAKDAGLAERRNHRLAQMRLTM